jgi:hypothetical protein
MRRRHRRNAKQIGSRAALTRSRRGHRVAQQGLKQCGDQGGVGDLNRSLRLAQRR